MRGEVPTQTRIDVATFAPVLELATLRISSRFCAGSLTSFSQSGCLRETRVAYSFRVCGGARTGIPGTWRPEAEAINGSWAEQPVFLQSSRLLRSCLVRAERIERVGVNTA
jgi:hypothetical protein